MLNKIDESELIAGLPELHELQTIDLRIGQLLDTRAALDDGSHKRGELDRARERLAHINEQLEEFSQREHDRKRERDTLLERREKNQHRLWQENPTPHEAEALQNDLQSTATRLDQIEIDLKDIQNRTEPLTGMAEDETRTVGELEEELEQVVAQFAEEVKDIDQELKLLHASRRSQAGRIDAHLLDRYERIRTRRGDPGVVKVTEEVCTACNTQLTSYMLRQLYAGERLQQCENCNTILYWAGEVRPMLTIEEWQESLDDEDEDEEE